ncbi:hypothetical protein JN531_016930 (plasmid) [Flagellatimonas centrodinii]|uniref:hypothetical protein n=1 Tax=Flagellatimonas centrodinii TaxID=2806210 RepID=UPI001FEF51ED|nr:hypothetical protein [Flagellatimonas centrodinii]ULQ48317.1 hypothetical protein JN531_016930 [Flagellatimonas centrodinii]
MQINIDPATRHCAHIVQAAEYIAKAHAAASSLGALGHHPGVGSFEFEQRMKWYRIKGPVDLHLLERGALRLGEAHELLERWIRQARGGSGMNALSVLAEARGTSAYAEGILRKATNNEWITPARRLIRVSYRALFRMKCVMSGMPVEDPPEDEALVTVCSHPDDYTRDAG